MLHVTANPRFPRITATKEISLALQKHDGTQGGTGKHSVENLKSDSLPREHGLPPQALSTAPRPYRGHASLQAQRAPFSLAGWTRSFAFAARGLDYPGYAFDGEETPERILELLSRSFRDWKSARLPGRLYSLRLERHPMPGTAGRGGDSRPCYFYVASCIDAQGRFMPIGAWICGPGDGEPFIVIGTDLMRRGVQDVLFVCTLSDGADRLYSGLFFPYAVFAEDAVQLLQPGASRSGERGFFRFLCQSLGNGARKSPEEELRQAEDVCRKVSPDWQALARSVCSTVRNLRDSYPYGVRLVLQPPAECLAQYRSPLAATLAIEFDDPGMALLHYYSGIMLKRWTTKLQARGWSLVRPALARFPAFQNRLNPLPPASDARAFYGDRHFRS